MNRATTQRRGDRTPVTGGIVAPARVRRPVTAPSAKPSASALDKHILRLLALHKGIATEVGAINLDNLDNAGKRALLKRINAALGIKPATT